MARWLWMAALFAISVPVFADGGTVVLRTQSGALTITVFASPAPLRAGPVDISLLIQSSDTLDPILDADVSLSFVKRGSESRTQATRNQQGNRLLYSTTVTLDDPGDWQFSATIRGGHAQAGPVVVSGTMAVAPEQPKLAAYSGFIALPFLVLILLVLHQWLRLRSGSPARALRY